VRASALPEKITRACSPPRAGWQIIAAAAARISQDLLGIRICFGALLLYYGGGWTTCVCLLWRQVCGILCLRRCYYTRGEQSAEDVQIFVSQQIGTGFHALNFNAGRGQIDNLAKLR
jgi:hypothetical protein